MLWLLLYGYIYVNVCKRARNLKYTSFTFEAVCFLLVKSELEWRGGYFYKFFTMESF